MSVYLKISVLIILCSFSLSAYAQNNRQENSHYNKQDNKIAQKIIALSPHAVEMLFAIGAGDRIIATIEHADYPQQALNIPRIGNHTGIQIEKLVELQPDLVVGWKSGNKQTDLHKIKSLGFNIYFTYPQSLKHLQQDLLKLGEFTGLKKNAEQVAKEVKQAYLTIKQKYANKKPVKVFYQLWHKPLRTISSGSWIDSMIKDCQGSNLFSETKNAYPVIAIEDVLVKDPQVIIVPEHPEIVDDKKNIWRQWKTIQAVKNEKILSVDGDLLHRFGPRIAQGLAQLCEAIDKAR